MTDPTCTHSTLFAEQSWARTAMPSMLGLAQIQRALQLSSPFIQASLLPKRLVCRMILRIRIIWGHILNPSILQGGGQEVVVPPALGPQPAAVPPPFQ